MSDIETTILREVHRRLARPGSKGSPSGHGFCEHCFQNEKYLHEQILAVVLAVANHADRVTKPEFYRGIYIAEMTDRQ